MTPSRIRTVPAAPSNAPAADETGPVDEWAHFVNVHMLDRQGNRINRRNPQDIFTPLYDHQIPPGAGQVLHYRIDVPKDADGPVELRARLRYRKFDYEYMKLVHDGKEPPKLPIVDVCEDRVVLPVAGVAANVLEGKVSKWLKDIVLLDQDSVKESKKKVSDLVKDYAAKNGAVEIKRFARFELGEARTGQADEPPRSVEISGDQQHDGRRPTVQHARRGQPGDLLSLNQGPLQQGLQENPPDGIPLVHVRHTGGGFVEQRPGLCCGQGGEDGDDCQ